MADMHFEENCPCGNSMKVSGFSSYVSTQIFQWRSIHNRHANNYAKAAVLAKEKKDNPPLIVSSGEFVNLPDGAFDLINVDVAEPFFGAQLGKQLLKTHGIALCRGPLGENGRPICCIHNPSNHHMLTWPQNWRGDKGMMERFCPHGNGHPDPDDLAVRTTSWARIHGCGCGCCEKPEEAATASSPDQPST
jgi:hypothetical protein